MATKQWDIVYETDRHFVKRLRSGAYEVYRMGDIASTRVAQIGYKGEKGLQRSIDEITRRERDQQNPSRPMTYKAAKKRILDSLEQFGWSVSSDLEVPHATSPYGRLYFKTQSIHADRGRPPYALGQARSLHIDMRELALLTPVEIDWRLRNELWEGPSPAPNPPRRSVWPAVGVAVTGLGLGAGLSRLLLGPPTRS